MGGDLLVMRILRELQCVEYPWGTSTAGDHGAGHVEIRRDVGQKDVVAGQSRGQHHPFGVIPTIDLHVCAVLEDAHGASVRVA